MVNSNTSKIKLLFLLLGLALYFSSFLYLGKAEPSGADITSNVTDVGPVIVPDGRADLGGRIMTLSLDVVQQDAAWKAYVGNITGSLVLRNANSQSIYEWALGSTLGGNIFVSRNDSVNWDAIRCANSSDILSEETALSMVNGASDSLNKTFNYTSHRGMVISGIGTIANNTCQSTATYVNGSAQTGDVNASYFQEILLSDTANLVYATFIDQDAWSFENNESLNTTYDFQMIIGENKTAASGYTYYFYADIY